MKNNIALAVAACLFIAAAPAFATEYPARNAADFRMTSVVYEANNVVQVDAMVGIVTHIQLEKGEHVLEHAFGNTSGWWFAAVDNNVFIKPRAQNASTNLVIITNKRVYNLYLHYAPWNPKAMQDFQVKFVYPEAVAAKLHAEHAAAVAKAELKQDFNAPRAVNWDYTMNGDTAMAPVHVWDNYQFTYFKFPGAVDLPEIYEVLPDGTEAIVNRNVTGPGNDTIVVHKVAREWVLRNGTRVMAIYNQHYSDGQLNKSGTASPYVIRTIQKGGK